jgi:hypothetical protein
MHACDLVQLAALVADHGRAFAEGPGRVSSAALEDYWTASKCRLERWSRSLKSFTTAMHLSRNDVLAQWPIVRPVIEEILLSETLTRVWSGVLAARDRRRGETEGEPIARSVMMGHLEARHRALTLLLHNPGVGTIAASELNRLRSRVERWVDLLVGGLLEDNEVNQFAIDPQRAREFAADLREHRQQPLAQHAWQLTLASLKSAFRPQQDSHSGNDDVNTRIAAAIVACFPPELFDATGVLQSLWVVRLTNATTDAQGMIDELVRMDDESVATKARPRRF